jgi:acyl carrier protein
MTATPTATTAGNDTAAVVRGAWEEVFGSPVDDGSDFFALGGDSLKAVSICSKVEEAVGARPRLRLLFDHPRFGDYVHELEVRS